MNIGKKTSWQVAAVSAAALLTGVAQAHDRDFNRNGHGEYERHHDGYAGRYVGRDFGGYYGRYDDARWHDRDWHSRHWRDDRLIWAPPLSPPWLYQHGFFGR
jgi:hypothetical protein